MKRFGLLVFFWISVQAIRAQMVTPFVYSPAGDFYLNSSANASLSFTVGELTMVETFSANSHFLTQGFQQPQNPITALEESFALEFILFPNPASEFINVRCRLSIPGEVTLRIWSMDGKEPLPPYSFRYEGGLLENQFDIHTLSAGFYIVEVRFVSTDGNQQAHEYHPFNVINP